jgi:hypothetical protein
VGRWVALVALLASGCASSSRAVTEWEMHVEGRVAPVHLPADLRGELPKHPAPLTLTARIPITETGASLVLPAVSGLREVRLDGDVVESVDGELEVVNVVRPHAFAIPASAVADGVAEIELRFDHRTELTARFFEPPRIATGPRGDTRHAWLRGINDVGTLGAIFCFLILGGIHAGLFFRDRSRKDDGWYAVYAISVLGILLTYGGLAHRLLGAYLLFVAWTISFVSVHLGTRFLYARTATPAPRWFGVTLLGAGIPWVIAPSPMRASLHSAISSALVAIAIAYAVIRTRRLTTEGASVREKLLARGVFVFVVLATPDILAAAGMVDLLGGVRLLGPAFLVLLTTTAATLAIDQLKLQRDLRQRVAELDVSNTELRRQIGERSKELAAALGQLGAVAARPAMLAPGAIVDGRYKVLRRIGAGGMGAVFEVSRLSDGERFAMKVLLDGGSGRSLARFAREAEIAAKTAHPNVLSVVDIGVADSGTMFVVMDLVTGGSVEERRDRFGDREWALPILRQVAHGLRALHEKDVVHRDLKPANLLLDEQGRVRVADFGIASLRDNSLVDALADTRGAGLTETGALLGTPNYMAPELARGAGRASRASDVFAFGIVAYEMLSGRAPFAHPPVLDALAGRESASPAPLGTTAVDVVVMRALSLAPELRPSLDEVLAAT